MFSVEKHSRSKTRSKQNRTAGINGNNRNLTACWPLQEFTLLPGQNQAKMVKQPKECPGKGDPQQKTAGHRLKMCLSIVTVMLLSRRQW